MSLRRQMTSNLSMSAPSRVYGRQYRRHLPPDMLTTIMTIPHIRMGMFALLLHEDPHSFRSLSKINSTCHQIWSDTSFWIFLVRKRSYDMTVTTPPKSSTHTSYVTPFREFMSMSSKPVKSTRLCPRGLKCGDSIWSPFGHFYATYQFSGDLALFDSWDGTCVWSTVPIHSRGSVRLEVHRDRDLCVIGWVDGMHAWTGARFEDALDAENESCEFAVTDEGELVVRCSQGIVRWTNSLCKNDYAEKMKRLEAKKKEQTVFCIHTAAIVFFGLFYGALATLVVTNSSM